jgi:hypothetical protein
VSGLRRVISLNKYLCNQKHKDFALELIAEPDSWYEVTVQGYNSEGSGDLGLKAIHTLPASGSADVKAIPFMGLEPPTNLEAEPTSPTSINLTWTSSQSAVNVSYYTVCYGLVQSSHAVNSSKCSYVSR